MTRTVLTWIGGTVAILALIVGVTIAGQRFGWWLRAYDVNQGAQVYQQGYGAQSAYAEEETRLIAQVAAIDTQITSPQTPADQKTALQSQRTAVVSQACDIVSKITHPAPNAQSFAANNC